MREGDRGGQSGRAKASRLKGEFRAFLRKCVDSSDPDAKGFRVLAASATGGSTYFLIEAWPAERKLTPTQLRVALLMSEGESNADIAEKLERSLNTVKNHVNAVFKTLEVGRRSEVWPKLLLLLLSEALAED